MFLSLHFFINFKRPSKCIEGLFLTTETSKLYVRSPIFRYYEFWLLNSTRRIFPESVFGKD